MTDDPTTVQRIRERAYEIWLREGQPQGRAEEHWERAKQEIMGDRSELTFEALHEMVLLERAIQESERLHPPLVMLMRQILRDFAYQEYLIPAGWLAMVSPAVSHRLPEVFADPFHEALRQADLLFCNATEAKAVTRAGTAEAASIRPTLS